MASLRLDIWSDLACPWCYVGKRRLEAALARFEHADDVEIVWRSFELDAAAPRQLEGNYIELLARKYRTSEAHGQAMIDRMTATAAAEGIAMRFDKIRPGNTFDGHRLLHLAGDRGLQGALKERLVRAYFCEGESLSDPATLARLAVEVGLDAAEVQEVLSSDRYATAVRSDEALARELEITGVPCFVLAQGELAVAGALPADDMLKALRDAWSAVEAARGEAGEAATGAGEERGDEGAACGPSGCD